MALNFSHRHVSEEPMKIADGVEGVSESNGGVFSLCWGSIIDKGGSFGSGTNTGCVFSQPWCSGNEKGDCFGSGTNTGCVFSQPWCSGNEKGGCFDYRRSAGDVFSQPWFSGNEKGECFGSGTNTGCVFSQPWCSGNEKGECFGCGRNIGDSASADVLDVLPSDPFGMDMNNTFTAIGWLEDLEVDYSGFRREEIGFGIGDGDHQQLFAGLSFIWNNAMRFQELRESSVYNNGSGSLFGFEEGCDGDGSCPGAFIPPTSVGESSERCNNDGGEDTNIHPAFEFCLYYLGLKDLLSVSMVCKSLHTIVCDDTLLWKHIHISQPLNEKKINDEALLQLTERAHGTMQCLRLVDCWKITEGCLRKVLERNPQIVKLGVPGCVRITIDGLVSILRDLKSVGKLKVKHLETGGPYGVTEDHYDELVNLLDIDNNVEQSIHKPLRFFHRRYTFDSCDDVRALDIEMCSICKSGMIVYDCPGEDCQGKEECRGCSLCIQRCFHCGRCINGGVYEETLFFEILCFRCWKPRNLSLL